ncbi:hypothetical protein M0R45_000557 [Rubus argutus]|uniref:Receptor ligand binding region domain-containing protein n=1 Tax=Rubus argutus TaxID=59490 RepID=A0AAW1VLJ6_RUBAR
MSVIDLDHIETELGDTQHEGNIDFDANNIGHNENDRDEVIPTLVETDLADNQQERNDFDANENDRDEAIPTLVNEQQSQSIPVDIYDLRTWDNLSSNLKEELLRNCPKRDMSIKHGPYNLLHRRDSKRNFVLRWSNLTSGQSQIGLNAYGLYAYDTVWLLARALDAFFDQGGNISFSNDSRVTQLGSGKLNQSLSIFDGGNVLLSNIFRVNMTGITSPIKYTPDRDLIHPAFEILNVIGTGIRKIGYWSNYSGLSVKPPETLYTKPPNRTSSSQILADLKLERRK